MSERLWVYDEHRRPREDNGELEIARFLESRHLEAQYEPWAYPLASGFRFQPDFWIPATRHRPEFHVEVTWLDWALARETRRIMATSEIQSNQKRLRKLRRNRETLKERWARKQSKIIEVKEQYGIDTILISYSVWVEVMADPHALDRLIGQVGLSLIPS